MNGTVTSAAANWWNLLRNLVVGAFLLMLAAGTLLPVYSDEIGWRFQERAWIDGVDKGYSGLCGPGSLAVPPWFMMPVRWFSATMNQAFADPLFVRLEGVICAFAWAALLWTLIARLEADRRKRVGLQTLAFAFMGMGTLPFLMVMSRPEQPLLLALTLMILIMLSRPGGLAVTTLKTAGIVLLATVATSYNLKGIAYAPVALACLLGCGRGRETLTPRLAGAAILVAMMATAAVYWVSRFACPGDAVLAQKLGEENLASLLALHAGVQNLALQLLKGLNPLTYVGLVIPSNDPMSSWLPANLFPQTVPVASKLALYGTWGLAGLVALPRLLCFAWREKLRTLAEPRAVLALAILACVVVWGMSQVNRNVYEATHVLPLLVFFLVLCLTLPQSPPTSEPRWPELILKWLVPVVGVVAVLSQAALLAFTVSPLFKAAHTPGYLVNQEFSVSIADYGKVRADIAKAMEGAGIDARQQLHGLLIDDVTYLALQRHRLPFHRLGVLDTWNASITNPAQFLIDHDSDGVVASCGRLPREMEFAATSSGEVCAISREGLRQIATPPPSMWDD
ncbi:MAG: hypothetical protein QM676_03785 [Novosphingobium sp.]